MTIKDLCEMMVKSGECKEYNRVVINGKSYCGSIDNCKQLQIGIDKYWKQDEEKTNA